MRKLLIHFLHFYQWALSPYFGGSCRFYPSCSHYAIEALDKHGAACGSWLAFRRVLRCHPWHPGGFDPVPEKDCSCHKHEVKGG